MVKQKEKTIEIGGIREATEIKPKINTKML
jgi:hypothetical protein